MERKLRLFGKTPLFRQRISIITSLVLAMLTVGTFFVKTSIIIDDLSEGQRNTKNAAVADITQTTCTLKVIRDRSSDKSIYRCLNNLFQNNPIHGKEYSFCYFVTDNQWGNDDGGHYDEEDSDVYDEEGKENEYKREDA